MNIPLNTYTFLIVLAVIIIVSHLFNIVSKKTKIPAVLLLILGGVGLSSGLDYLGMAKKFNFFSVLEVLGVVGLIMIVLEAALDLTLRRDKAQLILKSFLVAIIGLFVSAFACAGIFKIFQTDLTWATALYHATPLSILSSAIIIPSVSFLKEQKKEFHIYESTFSDILGIMLFYFLESVVNPKNTTNEATQSFFISLFFTIVISVLAGYLLIFIFQKIKTNAKLFLLISVLILLYSIGKLFHLSSLIIILIFGLMMSNENLFFRGPLQFLLDRSGLEKIKEGFHIVTIESAFVVRTFFFVVFGLTIDLNSLLSINVGLISALVILSIYLIRWALLRIFSGRDIFPQVYVAPRGLITVLLFFAIPASIKIPGFDDGIILSVIIGTSVIMALSLMSTGKEAEKELALAGLDNESDNEHSFVDPFLPESNKDMIIEEETENETKEEPSEIKDNQSEENSDEDIKKEKNNNDDEDVIEGGELCP